MPGMKMMGNGFGLMDQMRRLPTGGGNNTTRTTTAAPSSLAPIIMDILLGPGLTTVATIEWHMYAFSGLIAPIRAFLVLLERFQNQADLPAMHALLVHFQI